VTEPADDPGPRSNQSGGSEERAILRLLLRSGALGIDHVRERSETGFEMEMIQKKVGIPFEAECDGVGDIDVECNDEPGGPLVP
jgi:hypothetical protein